MSSDFNALATQNELSLKEDDIKRIVKLFRERSVTYLSPEREMGPFLLYSVGDSLETVAVKTNLPKDVILCTAIQYRWQEKIRYLKRDTLNILEVQKDLANTLLVATYKSILSDLGEVIAGKKDASEVGLIPKNITTLEKLMAMVKAVNAPEGAPINTTNVIHAQQVQVNQQVLEPKKETQIEIIDDKRKEMLEAIEK